MKLAKMRIDGFAYLDDVVITGQELFIILNLQDENNNSEIVRLKCSVTKVLRGYIINELYFELMKGHTVLIKFVAGYEKFSEVFYTQEDRVDHIVTFHAKLETINETYVNGAVLSNNICAKLAA